MIEQVLTRAGIRTDLCADLAAVRERLEDDCGSLLLTEEALAETALAPVLAWCEGQAPWSDLPVILLATKQAGPRSRPASEMLRKLGNVVLLERPINAETLTSAAQSALRARRRQYQTRSLILERERREQELRDLSATLERRVDERTAEHDRVWRNSRDLLVIIGADGLLRAVNPAWSVILGHSLASVVGHGFVDFVWHEDVPLARSVLDAAIVQRTQGDFEIRLHHRDGSPRWISWRTAAEGDLVYAYGRHITTEKNQAEALLQTADQLRQAQKMEAVGQLTGGLAHDFNNLLTGIGGSLEILQSRLAQGRLDGVERYMSAAQGALKRAAALTHRLLAFSRRQTLDPKPTNMAALIVDMEELIRRTVGPAIEIEVVNPPDLWTALVDRNQLENALLNLCINARDAMPDGGRISIETANRRVTVAEARRLELPAGEYLALCVTDTGCGMAQDTIDRAFDPFFTTKPLGQGTGLGLSMIYGFARQSGGQTRIQSTVGRGTVIHIYLPRHQGASVAPDPSARAVGTSRTTQGETVLVVDDEPTVRTLVAEVLTGLGYTTIEAADGPGGLDVLRSDTPIDLLVTDVGLPGGMNGRQVADAGRAGRPGLKVLFITGYAENNVVGSGGLEPGMHVLTKPFAMDDLASRIKDILRN